MAKAQAIPVTDLAGPAPLRAGRPKRAKAVAQTTAVAVPVTTAVARKPAKVPKASATNAATGSAATKSRSPKATTAGKLPRLTKPSTAPSQVPASEAAVAATVQAHAAAHRWSAALYVAIALVVLVVLAGVTYEVAYSGKILPGVTADGVHVGGLSQSAAAARISAQAQAFSDQTITIAYGNTLLHIPVSGLAPQYDAAHIASLAAGYGRGGDLTARFHQQLRAIFGRPTVVLTAGFDDSRLAPYLMQFDAAVSTPVQNATLSFDGDHAVVTPSATGTRLDIGELADDVENRLDATSTTTIQAPVYQLDPDLTTAAVQAVARDADSYLEGPLTLSYSGSTRTVDQPTLVTWLQVSPGASNTFLSDLDVAGINPPPALATLSLNHDAITNYVATLAGQIDQPAKNAQLAMQNNQLAVTAPSQNGLTLDQNAAVTAITASLTKPAADRTVSLNLASTPAAVNENNLASLGITQLLSQGVTNDYPSPAGRLKNIELGAARFNNALLSPGQQFSFGQILGPATPAQGYEEGWVILGNKEVEEPGGGLCQLVTTAFRAALLAGLPINERQNHAFTIPYYTWPYGIPGVDATIYYPELDLKFTNNTGHWILIQTNVNTSNNTVTYSFYGTKTKVGVIQGPYYVTSTGALSSNPNYANANEASHTVFYRQIQNLSGQVLETDTFNSYYQPESDYPPESD